MLTFPLKKIAAEEPLRKQINYTNSSNSLIPTWSFVLFYIVLVLDSPLEGDWSIQLFLSLSLYYISSSVKYRIYFIRCKFGNVTPLNKSKKLSFKYNYLELVIVDTTAAPGLYIVGQ